MSRRAGEDRGPEGVPLMTQADAIALLREMTGSVSMTEQQCTGETATCPVEECMVCAIRDCPDHEPLHYHHDGCPACYQVSRLAQREE